jgi:hypothetical protein
LTRGFPGPHSPSGAMRMGKDVERTEFTRADRQRFREKVRLCLDVFAQMLKQSAFDMDRPMSGLEVELNLVDSAGDPAMKNQDVLDAIADPDFQTELGQFNIEINLAPRVLGPDGLTGFEDSLRDSLNAAEGKAETVDTNIVMIGILPTLHHEHMGEDTLSSNQRYKVLNEQIFAARGEDLEITISGEERLVTQADTIAPESACTSVQYHLQVAPERFADFWNASQVIAGVQVALGANSPYLFGKQLWSESRIALFEQSTDTRPDELKAQGVRPRVWFGDRWITSIFDLFEENVRYYSALLPVCDDEDPAEVLAAGGTPQLSELRRGRGPSSPQGGEPGAAGRAYGGGRDGQRGALLRAGPRAGRPGASTVDADELLGGGGELPRRGEGRDRLAGVLAGHR